jgi:hypothetical protein
MSRGIKKTRRAARNARTRATGPRTLARKLWRAMLRRVLGRPALAQALLVALVACALSGELWARPGGGHTYSGGSRSSSSSSRSSSSSSRSSSSSGHGSYGSGYDSRSNDSGNYGGGGNDELVTWLLFRVLFSSPAIGIPVLIGIAILVLVIARSRSQDWDSTSASSNPPRRPPDLEKLRRQDPEFSVIVFEDFVYRLFATAHRARHASADLSALAPYLAEPVRARLEALPPVGSPFSHVVVGAQRLTAAQVPDAGVAAAQVRIGLLIDANLTAQTPRGPVSYFCKQEWTLVRAAGTLSKPLRSDDRFGCPNCGAPFRSGDASRCEFCGEVVTGGRFDWLVSELEVLELEERPPLLTSTVEEQGEDEPTVFNPNWQAEWAALRADDPALDAGALEARLRLIYARLNESWTALDLRPARPLVSDGMFDYLDYWISAYKQQGKRNILRDMRILRVQPVKVTRDRHFDAVTLRFWATGKDYTIDERTQAVESGSNSRERSYSEYWTLIRGHEVRGTPQAAPNCPSCGAPLETSMAGVCAHCSQHITSGEFDFVLSKIEQDDSYAG